MFVCEIEDSGSACLHRRAVAGGGFDKFYLFLLPAGTAVVSEGGIVGSGEVRRHRASTASRAQCEFIFV